MNKLVLTLVIALCSIQVCFSQYDEATRSKIKVKFFAAKELLESGEYSNAISKVNEIETITNGPKSSEVQNIKVKSYIGSGMYERAKIELNMLYKLSPTNEVLKDIASYESKIEDGIAEERARMERVRLAEIERKEQVEQRQIALKNAVNNFAYKPCDYCNYKGEEAYSVEVPCNGHACENGNYKRYYHNGTYEWETCEVCDGTGRKNISKYRKCTACGGSNKTLQYVGEDYLSETDINNVLNNNLQEITRLADIKSKEEARLAEIKRKEYDLKQKSSPDPERAETYKKKTKHVEYELVTSYSNRYFSSPSECNYWNSEGIIELTIPETSKIFEKGYSYMFYDFYNGYAQVSRIEGEPRYERNIGTHKNGLINKKGELVVPFIFDDIGTGYSNGLIPVAMRTGKIVKNEWSGSKEDEKKWGFSDLTGKVVIPLMYKSVRFFENGKAEVRIKGKKWFYINKAGEKIE